MILIVQGTNFHVRAAGIVPLPGHPKLNRDMAHRPQRRFRQASLTRKRPGDCLGTRRLNKSFLKLN
ncbi:hypothetical protein J2805_003989 [Arthrobacter oryzae]|nr:hypothetical protein [Arthrobacter oryzae]